MIDRLITALNIEVDLSAEEIADTIWLALQIQPESRAIALRVEDKTNLPDRDRAFLEGENLPEIPARVGEAQKEKQSPKEAGIYPQTQQKTAFSLDFPVKIPDAPSLRSPLQLVRALKPLMRRIPSGRNMVLDEAETTQCIAEEGIWMPVLKPTLEPWLDLELVVDESLSMHLWRRAIKEWIRLLKNYGIFRDVRVWGLLEEEGRVGIRRGIGGMAKNQRLRSPAELIDSTGRRLVLVVSDCVSSLWREGQMVEILALWGNRQPMAIAQMLPRWLWGRTALGRGSEVRLRGLAIGAANGELLAESLSLWDEDEGINVPVLTLEVERAAIWAKMVAGKGVWCTGVAFAREGWRERSEVKERDRLTAEERVQGFRVTASPVARKLAGLLASAPVITLPVVRLIREKCLRESQQVNMAEVFLGGLLKPLSAINADTNPDFVRYDFIEGVRELLIESVPSSYVLDVVDQVSQLIARKLGLSLENFVAILKNPQATRDSNIAEEVRPFAMVTAQVLRCLGGEYSRFAEELESVEYKIDLGSRAKNRPFILPQSGVSTFTGREKELEKLKVLLIDPQKIKQPRIVSLGGMGGIGKSALACHFATQYKEHFTDGVIGLRVDGKDVETIAQDFAREMGVVFEEEEEQALDAATIMQDLFASRRMLLIFDNADEASIKKLRPGGNVCAIIVTTRDRSLSFFLDIPNEGTIDLSPLIEQDSLLLLQRILGEQRINKELDTAREIIKYLGNLPLALQITGRTLQSTKRPLWDYLEELKETHLKLSIQGNEDFNLIASLRLSLDLLTEEEIDFFACLSSCAEDGFSRKTAMIAGEIKNRWEAQKYLDRFYQLSLVNYTEEGENRFVLHPLARAFSLVLADLRELNKLADIKEKQGQWDEAIFAFERQIKINETLDDQKSIAIALNRMGNLLRKQEKFDEAIAAFQREIEVSEAINDQKQIAIALNRMGGLLQQQGRIEEAISAFQREIEVSEAINDQKEIAIALNCMGGLLQQQGRIEEAISAFQRQIEVSEAINDQKQIAIALNCMGGLLQQQGRIEDAIAAFQRQIEVSEAINEQKSVAIALNCMGGLLQQQGRIEEAISAFQRQIDISEAINDQQGIAIALNRMGGLLQQQGRIEEAISAFQRQIEVSEAINEHKSVAIALNCMGGLLQQQGRIEEAIAAFQRQIDVSEAINDRKGMEIELHKLGNLLKGQQKFAEAEKTFRQSYDIAVQLEDRRGQALILNSLGQVLSKQGGQENINLALINFRESIKLGKELNDLEHLAKVHTAMGEALFAYHNDEQAAIELIKGFEIEENSKNTRGLEIVIKPLMYVLVKLNKKEEAKEYCQRALAIAPNNKNILELEKQLSSGIFLKQGKVIQIKHNQKDTMYGWITPSDRSNSIRFHEHFINSDCISQLKVGTRVEVFIKKGKKGWLATYIRILDDAIKSN